MPKSTSGVYAVAVGRKPGLYFTWEECRQQTSGWHGSKHQKFISTSEAEDWLQQHGILVETTRTDEPPQTPTIAVFDNTDTVKPAKATQELTSQELIWYDVYTDGACKGNQNADSKAGIGVWWGHNDPRNLSERCPGKQSNNCAELTAIVRALETTPDHYNLCIKTDSKYAIDAMTRWFQSWRFNEFKNSEGQEVVNLPILLHLNASLGRRTGMTKLEHVKGHSTSVGNNAADRLAVAGAEKDVVPDRKWEYGTWNRDEIVPFWQEVWQQRKKAREAGKQESPDEKKTRKSSVQFLVPPKDDALFDEERIPEIPSRSTEKSKQVKTEPPVTSNQEWQVVYTDGGCKGNQGPDGRAGIGVWWGQQDLRNIAERCPGTQTNNRAELIAVIRALEEAPGDVPLIIRTDSKYVIDSMEKYLKKWIQNDFLTSSSGPVKNVPLIKHLNCLLGRRVGETKFEHVKGHSGEEGNEGADKLANRGSFMPEVREPNWLYANEEKVSFWMDTWKERREAQALAGFEFDESFLLDDDELSQLANTGEFD
jgi:ribonuclease HI